MTDTTETTPPASMTSVSIVVPTFREADNIEALIRAIAAVCTPLYDCWNVIIVDDDSADATAAVVERLAKTYPVQCHIRQNKMRDLSLSVLAGIERSTGDVIVVMDADLSHPPTSIPAMVQRLADPTIEFVLGSRYVAGGSFDRAWDFWRYINSRVATMLVAPLTPCTDPMSGFFACRRTDLPNPAELSPIGYKIALELIVRGQFESIEEVPIRFQDREKGKSKMNMQQQLRFLEHIRRLYLFRYPRPVELMHFLGVGASGFVLDVTVYYLLQLIGFDHRVARACSFWPAVTSNWFLNRHSTFSERARRPGFRQWLEFVATSLLGFCISWGAYTGMTTFVDFFDQWRLLALLFGTALGSIFNFVGASFFVYNEKRH